MFLPILKLRNFYKSSIITVLLFMKFVTNGAAIKCFVCDSSDNKSCANLKSNASIVAELKTNTTNVTTILMGLFRSLPIN
uniref:Protein quiver n=1 Tax=Glossina palpalis gambiensis TaxID=67801 RepID=A0A1B0BG28_9MUSC